MATAYKVLGQSAPSATSLTTLYTVPSATDAVCSTLTVCNRSASNDTFRVAVRPAGASIEDKHYIAYDSQVNANDTVFLTLGISLDATDVVSVYAGTANLAFNLFGVEIT